MKNGNLKFGMIAGFLLFSSITFADANGCDKTNDVQHLDVKVTSNERNMVYVDFKKVQDETIDIRIYDQNSVLLDTRKVEKNAKVITKYDLPNISNEIYSFEVIDTQMMKEKLHEE